MLVEQGVEVGRQQGLEMGQEWTGHWSAGQAEGGGTAEPGTGGTGSGLTRELGRRGREGRLQHRFAVLLQALVTGQDGIHTELQQGPGVA